MGRRAVAFLAGPGRIVARTRASAEKQGQLAIPVETVYRSLPGLGAWVVALGIPLSTLEGPVRRALVLLAGAGCAGLLPAVEKLALRSRSAIVRYAAKRGWPNGQDGL